MNTTRHAARQAEVVAALRPALTPRAVTALVDLIHALRPEWGSAGIRAAIRACEHGDPYTVAQALIQRAKNPANRTPQLQPADLDVTPAARQPCTRNGCWPHGRCAGCYVDSGAAHDANTCDAPPPFVVVGKPYDLASPHGHFGDAR